MYTIPYGGNSSIINSCSSNGNFLRLKSAFILATPVIFANLLLMMVMGIIARAIPQMNILMVSFVVNIGVGLFVFTVTSTEFFNSAFRFYTEKLGEWFNLIN